MCATIAGPPKAVRPSLRKDKKRFLTVGLLFKRYLLFVYTLLSVEIVQINNNFKLKNPVYLLSSWIP